jgi:holo-[acyl-carrier protein] synthase
MILGIGSDIVDIRRIEKTLAHFGDRFENRVFSEHEQHKALSRKNAGAKIVASSYAKRFAAKEACAKALGTGMSDKIFWRDLEVLSLPSGAPTMRLRGGALSKLKAMTPAGMKPIIHVSMSDDYPYAQAFVILSAETK